MTQFVESLARLLKEKKITEDKVKTLFTQNKITSSEYVYILNYAKG